MTGLDCLREELKERGMNKAQIESKIVPVILDIVSNSGDKYLKISEEERIETEKLIRIKNEIQELMDKLAYYRQLELKYESEIRIAEEHRRHCEDYIDEFNKSLSECETERGRDAMRVAQMFVNSVNPKTADDNTAYIIGIASILSQGGINAINELQKINRKLPPIDAWVNCARKLRI